MRVPMVVESKLLQSDAEVRRIPHELAQYPEGGDADLTTNVEAKLRASCSLAAYCR
jgi:hypothetical protein